MNNLHYCLIVQEYINT